MKKTIIIFSILVLTNLAHANNIQVTNVSLASQQTIQNYYMVEFDLSWENSWRTSNYESNWDAAWVFLKFTYKDKHQWEHAHLHYVDGVNDGHIAPAGATINTAHNTHGNTSVGMGVFIYRSGNGIGNVNYQNVQLRWDYGSHGIADNDVIEISVHAIEMVYVRQGAFYVGDGSGNTGVFEAGNTGNPYYITTENTITLGGTSSNNLSNHNALNMLNPDDFNYSTTKTLPGAFPKGVDAFYCMKYECSQDQYADFLFHLTETQRAYRDGPYIDPNTNIATQLFPIEAGKHFAKADFPWRPMNYISWQDMAAYLAWSSLRPMSELEYEKACRGLNEPVEEEYAWGNGSWYRISGEYYTIQYEGTPNEVISSGIAENAGNANIISPISGSLDLVRCGIFSASATNKTRQETGATYWGIMEMTGNAFEQVISVGNSQSRDFTGKHGDGAVTNIGDATFGLLFDWAFANASGVGQKGSSVSHRYSANTNESLRSKYQGIRGVRSAQ